MGRFFDWHFMLMIMKLLRFVLILSLLSTGACNLLPRLEETPLPPATTPTSTRLPADITLTPESTATATGPVTLRVWLPPEFDPAAETLAGALLQERLSEFAARRPRVRLDIRVKNLADPGGILEALSSTSAAAPLALPDLVALPRPLLEAAALKGLLYPFDGLTVTLDDADWYDYARRLARLQNSSFGIPFAGDALVLVYRPGVIEEPPRNWTHVLETIGPLVIPAADPQALYTLNLYQAAGGPVQDEQGLPMLEASTLTRVLSLFQEAAVTESLPLWVTQLESDEQVWEAYLDNRGPMMITWASRYLQGKPEDSAMTSLPATGEAPFTLATGWVWSLGSPEIVKQELAVQLAEFLTEPVFLAEWTAAAGYLPPRASALDRWPAGETRSLASHIVLSMHPKPSSDVLSSLSPPLKQVTIEALKQQREPALLAEEAVEGLDNP